VLKERRCIFMMLVSITCDVIFFSPLMISLFSCMLRHEKLEQNEALNGC
jgi:hypothetical protein